MDRPPRLALASAVEPPPSAPDPRYAPGGVACELCSDTGLDLMFDGSTRPCPCAIEVSS